MGTNKILSLRNISFVFLLGVLLVCIGAYLKVSHFSFANAILSIGMIAEVVSIILFLFYFFSRKKIAVK